MTSILSRRYYVHSELVHFAAEMNSGSDVGSIQLAPRFENGDVCCCMLLDGWEMKTEIQTQTRAAAIGAQLDALFGGFVLLLEDCPAEQLIDASAPGSTRTCALKTVDLTVFGL
jgi:hypothetical protein